ncbi:MAG: hypothetical protein HFG92_03295 [Dorea sp.]|jgi:hypothetical protein|nr:hypothetical protein [Dorea sp.]
MAEKVKSTGRINFYEEKKWIMAYWFKTSRKEQFTEMYLWELWQKWFGKDFNSKSDERFQEILLWIKEVRRTMSKAEIKAKRHEVADCHSMPPYIRQLADKKGYYVRKCSTRRHPLRVSGYAIFKNEKDKQAKYGKKFNLTVQQVREILEAKEDK